MRKNSKERAIRLLCVWLWVDLVVAPVIVLVYLHLCSSCTSDLHRQLRRVFASAAFRDTTRTDQRQRWNQPPSRGHIAAYRVDSWESKKGSSETI